jgi:hypothetical protein
MLQSTTNVDHIKIDLQYAIDEEVRCNDDAAEVLLARRKGPLPMLGVAPEVLNRKAKTEARIGPIGRDMLFMGLIMHAHLHGFKVLQELDLSTIELDLARLLSSQPLAS